MFYDCKLCGNSLLYDKEIWDSQLPNAHLYKCHLCPEYNLLLASDMKTVESEGIRIANFKLVFFPNSKKANLWQNEFGDIYKAIRVSSITMNELSHELAVQWLNKLKTYVTFQ